MKCLRCGNSDPAYFYKGSRGYYCRRCIRFSRLLLEEEPSQFDYSVTGGVEEYRFDYRLTPAQEKASLQCAEAIKRSDVLLNCVCGAGKTEIVVESIARCIAQGKKAAYAIARKEVVIELSKRFSGIFPKAEVTAVYGGHTGKLDGDLIVCTCHQLYRYYRTFDLLVLDEVDAFPLQGNETLMNIAVNSCRGRIIFSTATVDEGLQKILDKRQHEIIELNVRPSGRPLSVPKLIYLSFPLACVVLFLMLKKAERRCMIFVCDRRSCRMLWRIFSRFFSCTYVYSDLAERNENIAAFRSGKKRFIFTTSVLERGITVRNIDVMIMDYGQRFSASGLIQMLGRVGRGLDSEGSSYIFSPFPSARIRSVMNYLNKANSDL